METETKISPGDALLNVFNEALTYEGFTFKERCTYLNAANMALWTLHQRKLAFDRDTAARNIEALIAEMDGLAFVDADDLMDKAQAITTAAHMLEVVRDPDYRMNAGNVV